MKTTIMKISVAAACLTLAVDFAVAAKVETIKVRSESMDKDVPVAVVLPDGYDPAKKYPVVYMTHGAGGDYKTMTTEDWLAQCDKYAFIGISPDGGKTSWWWDAPADPTYRYETFFINEMMPFVEKKYSVDARRERRAIVGGSMGGGTARAGSDSAIRIASARLARSSVAWTSVRFRTTGTSPSASDP